MAMRMQIGCLSEIFAAYIALYPTYVGYPHRCASANISAWPSLVQKPQLRKQILIKDNGSRSNDNRSGSNNNGLRSNNSGSNFNHYGSGSNEKGLDPTTTEPDTTKMNPDPMTSKLRIRYLHCLLCLVCHEL